MGEIPKKEQKPVPPIPVPTEKMEKTGTSTPFSSPGRFSSPSNLFLLLCASAVVLIGGVLFFAMTRPSPTALSDVTRSPLGFDVGQLEDEETDITEEKNALLANVNVNPSNPISFTTQNPPSSSYTQPTYTQPTYTQPTYTPPTPPSTSTPPAVKMPPRRPPPTPTPSTTNTNTNTNTNTSPEPYQDTQIYDEDLDDNTPLELQAKGPEFYQRVDMLEKEIHELRTVLAQRERMIVQLSRELTESRARPPLIAMEPTPPPLEPVAMPMRTHTVRKGETLSEIAQRYYGTRTAWAKLYRANAEKLPDKNRLPVGVILIIPE